MKLEEKEILRKKRILEYAEACGNVLKTCRHFGVSRSNFYLWRAAYRRQGNAGLVRKKPIARSHPNQTPAEVVEKVLYLRQKYHLGPIRIVWYMRRYHDIRISDAGVYRVLRRNGLSRLPRKAERRPFAGATRKDRILAREVACAAWPENDALIAFASVSKRSPTGKGEWEVPSAFRLPQTALTSLAYSAALSSSVSSHMSWMKNALLVATMTKWA